MNYASMLDHKHYKIFYRYIYWLYNYDLFKIRSKQVMKIELLQAIPIVKDSDKVSV